jgi:hypothetical protein
MFLYFYEAKMIVGFNSQIPNQWLKECDEFDINDKKEDERWFNGWETEENIDGTFCLVFIDKSKTHYLGSSIFYDGLKINNDFFRSTNHYSVKRAQKFVFDDEGTTILYDETKYKLRSMRTTDNTNNTIYLLAGETDDGEFSCKVCLTNTSNIRTSYVLK